MKLTASLLLVGVVVMPVLLAGCSGGLVKSPVTPEVEKHQFQVNAADMWLATVVEVTQGARMTFDATGLAKFSIPGDPANGPEGQSTSEPVYLTTALAKGELAELGDDGKYHFYALVCRVGDGVPVYVGAHRVITANASGMLYLAANDQEACYYDNSGYWDVNVKIEK
jgi:hypothetical protein